MADAPTDQNIIDPIEAEAAPEPSKLTPEEQMQTFKQWFKADQGHSQKWRAQARDDFDFVAGDQWKPDDRSKLEAQGRPVITFNRTLGLIKVVTGVEISSRHETQFMPRESGPDAEMEVKANELLSGASQWMTDECDAEDHQSEAFGDCAICGIGVTEATIEYEEDPDGKYIERRIDPLEIYWDEDAREKNLSDARRFSRVRTMPISRARQLFPGFADGHLDAAWALGSKATAGEPTPIEERRKRLENTTRYDTRLTVTIVQMEWCEREPIYRVADPRSDQVVTIEADKYEMLAPVLPSYGIDLNSVQKAYRRVWYQAFLGDKVLKMQRSTYPKGSTFSVVTGEKHRNLGTFFGLVSVARDPQMWANKWLSQTLHILNTTAKGGIVAEKGVFANQRDAEATWAMPDAITVVKDGAVKDGRIMAKPGQGLPTGYINLLEFAISSIRDVTGINLELMGMRDANQPGILEAQRKQAAMTILATLFDSMRRFRKINGRIRLHYIKNYLSDGRLIRIGGPDGRRIIPLLKSQIEGEYDVIVEDAPSSPNQKQETWAYVQGILPALKGLLTPQTLVIILEYSPLPTKLVQAIKQALSQPPDPMMIEGKKVALEGAKAEVMGEYANVEATKAKAFKDRIQAAVDMITAGLSAHQAQYPQQPMQPQQAMPALPAPMPQQPPMMPVGNSLPPDFAIPPMGGGIPGPMPIPQMPVQGAPRPQPQGLLDEAMPAPPQPMI